MSDELVELGKHLGTGVGGAGTVGLLMKWLWGKEQGAVATKLAVIEQQLSQISASLAKTESHGERLALLEGAVKTAHERIDALTKRRR